MNASFWWNVSRGFSFGVGLAFVILLGRCLTSMLLTCIKREFASHVARVFSNDNVTKRFIGESHPNVAFYQALEQVDPGGAIIGHLEVVVGFIAGWFGKLEILAGLLAFKVASKWEAWKNMQAWPPLASMDEYIRARYMRSMNYTTFFVGTITNLAISYSSGVFAQFVLAEKLYDLFI